MSLRNELSFLIDMVSQNKTLALGKAARSIENGDFSRAPRLQQILNNITFIST